MTGFGFPKDLIINSLEQCKLDHITTTYYLLSK